MFDRDELLGLRSMAETLADATELRKAVENRAKRGVIADEMLRAHMIGSAQDFERLCRHLLMDEYRRCVPAHVQEWAAGVPGMATGALFPKLLGLIGNPRVATPYRWQEGSGTGPKRVLVPDGPPYARGSDRSPNPAYGDNSPYDYGLRQLWRFCGCGDPEDKPRKGMTQEELLRSGKRRSVYPVLHTFAVGVVRAHKRSEAVRTSPYYKVYAAAMATAHGEGKRHVTQCQNHKVPPMRPDGCGTVAHPEWGEPGSPWRAGHYQGHALRMVAKQLLADLYDVWGAEQVD
jgi:hypothetical protein